LFLAQCNQSKLIGRIALNGGEEIFEIRTSQSKRDNNRPTIWQPLCPE
jgi:hypothetical protein